MQQQTPIQERIERVVTNGLGYSVYDDRRFFKRMHSVPPQDTAEDLQLHLYCMEVNGLSMEEILKGRAKQDGPLPGLIDFVDSGLWKSSRYSVVFDRSGLMGHVVVEPAISPDPRRIIGVSYGSAEPISHRQFLPTDRSE